MSLAYRPDLKSVGGDFTLPSGDIRLGWKASFQQSTYSCIKKVSRPGESVTYLSVFLVWNSKLFFFLWFSLWMDCDARFLISATETVRAAAICTFCGSCYHCSYLVRWTCGLTQDGYCICLDSFASHLLSPYTRIPCLASPRTGLWQTRWIFRPGMRATSRCKTIWIFLDEIQSFSWKSGLSEESHTLIFSVPNSGEIQRPPKLTR